MNQKEISYDIDIIKSKIERTEEKINNYIKLRTEIKNDLKENYILENEYWEYSSEYSKKIKELKEEKNILINRLEKISFESEDDKKWIDEIKKMSEIKDLNRLLIDELVEDIVIDKDGNVKIIFKYKDKYFEAVDFINRYKYDIISSV